MRLLRRLAEKGAHGAWLALRARAVRPLHQWRTRAAPRYRAPDAHELCRIEERLQALGMHCAELRVDAHAFAAFRGRFSFPADYHGGEGGGVYLEKMLEHYIAWSLLGLERDAARWPYVDVASASSPWARLLREQGLAAWSIDLAPDPALSRLDYYLRGDATAMPFEAAGIGSASLQCAYEMFEGDADTRLLVELARVLRPGGRALISPLYMHLRACYYQSPEHYGRPYGDPGAERLLRPDAWDVRASRKYSPETLLERVWLPAQRTGLVPGLHVLRDAGALGPGLYLHFVLTLDRSA